MAKNQIQFQKGLSLPEFMDTYGSEEQCKQALHSMKWPQGYTCPECGGTRHCFIKDRNLYQCNHCHHQTSLTSHTIFANTNLPLTRWFLAIHLITQAKTGLSALALMRHMGVSYNTAWSMKQKIMQVMKEQDDGKPLSGIIQLDDVYHGGERHGGKRGRGSSNKTPFVAAVSTNLDGHPIRMSMKVVNGFKREDISRWAKLHLSPGCLVVSDGLACFSGVEDAGCWHVPIVTGGGAESVKKEEFLWVNTMIGNVKNAIKGVYHSARHQHLPRYLAEFCYRFNRRFELRAMLPRFLRAAVNTPPMPLHLLTLAESCG